MSLMNEVRMRLWVNVYSNNCVALKHAIAAKVADDALRAFDDKFGYKVERKKPMMRCVKRRRRIGRYETINQQEAAS